MENNLSELTVFSLARAFALLSPVMKTVPAAASGPGLPGICPSPSMRLGQVHHPFLLFPLKGFHKHCRTKSRAYLVSPTHMHATPGLKSPEISTEMGCLDSDKKKKCSIVLMSSSTTLRAFIVILRD